MSHGVCVLGGEGGGGQGFIVLKIYVALAVFQPYRDLEAGDNQSLKYKWRGRESNPGPLAPQAKHLTTRLPPLLGGGGRSMKRYILTCDWNGI